MPKYHETTNIGSWEGAKSAKRVQIFPVYRRKKSKACANTTRYIDQNFTFFFCCGGGSASLISSQRFQRFRNITFLHMRSGGEVNDRGVGILREPT